MSVNFPGHGRFRMLAMAMGMQAASATFQSIMDRVLRGLESFTASYIDDLTIFSNTWEEHLSHVALVLDRLASAGFTLRPKKCHIGVREVEFLGYIADGEGHRPSSANTAAIAGMSFPEHPDAMRSWIGLVNFYSNSIPRCAILMEKLQDRVNQRRTGPPSGEELAAFITLRDTLADPKGPVLGRPDFEDDFYISVDAASTVGVGAVLWQRRDGREVPIQWYSRRFTHSELNWIPVEQECFGLVAAVQRWRHFLAHRPFFVLTDAEPLIYLRDKLNPPPGSRIHAWLLELQGFAFTLIHRPGRLHINADCISRLADHVKEVLEKRAREFACEVPASLPIAVAIATAAWPRELEGSPTERRVAALITDGRAVLMARLADGSLTLGSVPQRRDRQPLGELCGQSVGQFLWDAPSTTIARLVGRSRRVLRAPNHRFLIVPRARAALGHAPLHANAEWIELANLSSLEGIRCAIDAELWALQALHHCASCWARGVDTPLHPSISRAFTDLGLLAAQAPAVSPCVAMLAACEVCPSNTTVDGRPVPNALLADEKEIIATLQALHATVAKLKADASETSPAAVAIDMEFSLRPDGARQSCDVLQIACGELILVFDVMANRRLLRERHFVPGVPSLRDLLSDREVVKVLHHGSNDAMVLCAYDIAIAPVFDTAIADALLSQGSTAVRNLAAVHDDWLLERMRRDFPERAASMLDSLLPSKHTFDFVWGLFKKRPLESTLLQYCWQDVAYMPLLYQVLRANLLAIHPLALRLALVLSEKTVSGGARTSVPRFLACICANLDGVVCSTAALAARVASASLIADENPTDLGIAVRALARSWCDGLTAGSAEDLRARRHFLGATKPRRIGSAACTRFHLLHASGWIPEIKPTSWSDALAGQHTPYTRFGLALALLGVARQHAVSPFAILLQDVLPSPGLQAHAGEEASDANLCATSRSLASSVLRSRACSESVETPTMHAVRRGAGRVPTDEVSGGAHVFAAASAGLSCPAPLRPDLGGMPSALDAALWWLGPAYRRPGARDIDWSCEIERGWAAQGRVAAASTRAPRPAPPSAIAEPIGEGGDEATHAAVVVTCGRFVLLVKSATGGYSVPTILCAKGHLPLHLAELALRARCGPVHESMPASARKTFERASFVAAGHIRAGKARTAIFAARSPVALDTLTGALAAGFARRTCPPSQAVAWESTRVVELTELEAAGVEPAVRQAIELAVSAPPPPSEPEEPPPLLTFAGGGMQRHVTFYEELDTEYWASHHDPLFNPIEGEVAPPQLGALPGVGAVAALIPALEQEGELRPGSASQRPTATRVQQKVPNHETPLAGASDQPGTNGGADYPGPHGLRPHLDVVERLWQHLVPEGADTPVSTDELRKQQAQDGFCAPYLALLRAQAGEEGAAAAWESLRAELTPKEARRVTRACSTGHFAVREGLLCRLSETIDNLDRLAMPVLPPALRSAVLTATHDTTLHPGRDRTLAVVAARYWWPGMGQDVADFVKECPTCAFNDKQRPVDGGHTPGRGAQPWRHVQADVVYLEPTLAGNDCAVVFIDRYTRRPRLFPARKTMTSKDFLNILLFGLLKEVGWPEVLVTDRGSILISAYMQRFYKATGISHVAADAHMHTAVGCCERFNATLRSMARAAYFDSAFQWDVWLPLIELFYAARPQPGLAGYSPFFLDTGRSPRLPWDLVYSAPPADASAPEPEEMELRVTRLHQAWRAAQAEIDLREGQRAGDRAAKHRPAPTFKAGDRVLIERPPEARGSKMEFPHFGPFIVKECLERDRYRLVDPHGRRLPNGMHDEVHVRRLKRMPALSREAIIDAGLQYEVEKIVDHRYSKQRGCREFRLRYSHYEPSDDTWEPASSLNGPALDMLDEYLAKRGLSRRVSSEGGVEPPPPPAIEPAPPAEPAPALAPPPAPEPYGLDHIAARDERRERRAAEREARLGARGA